VSEQTRRLFASDLKVVNVGSASFTEALLAQGVQVRQVDWRPPAGGDRELARLLEKMGIR
jgi:hypothetical protein